MKVGYGHGTENSRPAGRATRALARIFRTRGGACGGRRTPARAACARQGRGRGGQDGPVATLAEPHAIDADELYRKTFGNPFFVTEVLAAGEEQIPNTVSDAVLARAARLSPEAHTLLEAVAVMPPEAELWLLGTLAGQAIDHLEECVSSGMLRSESQAVAFRHELARLAVESSLPPNRRIALHRKALAGLATPPTG